MNNWAVKYRPTNFREVKGQPEKALLWNMLLSGEDLPPALLLAGPPGTGKTSLGRIIAKAINCDSFISVKDCCGVCSSCVAMSSNTSPLVIEYDAASNSGADDMRRVRELSSIISPSGKYVFIIDEAHSLSHQAWNVLLKTMEEPISNCLFILITSEPSKVPSKIRTRTIRFDLRRVPPKDLFALLTDVVEKESVVEAPLDKIIDMSDGSPREALKLLEQFHLNGLPEFSVRLLTIRYLATLVKGDLALSLSALSTLWDAGSEFSTIISELSWVLEKIVFIQNGIPVEISSGTTKKLNTLSTHLDSEQLGVVLEKTARLSFSVGRSGSKPDLIFLTTEIIRCLHGGTSIHAPSQAKESSEPEIISSAEDILEGATFDGF